MSNFSPLPSQSYLQSVLIYHRDTGLVFWRTHKAGRSLSTPVGSNSRGYLVVRISGVLYFLHRVIWKYETGEDPSQYLDHLNGVCADNRFENLRVVTPLENSQNNHRARVDNTSGYLGVSKRRGGFRASIQVDKVGIHLGDYETAELASKAYLSAKRKLHSSCTI